MPIYDTELSYVRTAPLWFECKVSDTDYTQQLIEAKGSYSPYGPQGFCTVTGSFKFSMPLDALYTVNGSVPGVLPIMPDDNPRSDFAVGQRITLKIDADERQIGLNPRFADCIGNSFIAETYYDEEAGVLEVQTGCMLALCNSRTPADIGVCVSFGAEDVTYEQIMTVLLSKAGVKGAGATSQNTGAKLTYACFAPPSGKWTFPIELGQGDSFLGLAGQIAFANGRVMYQSAGGVIIDKPFRLEPNLANIKAKDFIINTKANAAQMPPKKLIMLGNTVEYKKLKDSEMAEVSEEAEFTNAGPITTLRTTDVEQTHRRITNIVFQTGPYSEVSGGIFPAAPPVTLTFLDEKVVTHYETVANSGDAPKLDADLGKCFPPDEGRLLKITTVRDEPKVKIFGAYYSALLAYAQESGDTNLPFDFNEVIAVTRSFESEEEWTYDIRDPQPPRAFTGVPPFVPIGAQPTNGFGYYSKITQTVTIKEPFAAVYPSQCGRLAVLIKELEANGTNVSGDFNFSAIVTSQTITTTWLHRQDTKKWEKRVKASGLAGRGGDTGAIDVRLTAAENAETDSAKSFNMLSAFNLMQKSGLQSQTRESNSPPPDSRWPGNITEERFPFEESAGSSLLYSSGTGISGFSGKIETISFGDFSLLSSTDLRFFVEDYYRYLVGKWQARQFIFPASLLKILPNYDMPVHSTITIEPGLKSPGGVVMIDSPSFALTPTECIKGFTGVMLSGYSGNQPSYPNSITPEAGLVVLPGSCSFSLPVTINADATIVVAMLVEKAPGEYEPYGADPVTITVPAGVYGPEAGPWLPSPANRPLQIALRPNATVDGYNFVLRNTVNVPGIRLVVMAGNAELCFEQGDAVTDAISIYPSPVLPLPILPQGEPVNKPGFELVDNFYAEAVRVLTDAYTFQMPYHDTFKVVVEAELKPVYDGLLAESAEGLDFMLFEGQTTEDFAILQAEQWQ